MEKCLINLLRKEFFMNSALADYKKELVSEINNIPEEYLYNLLQIIRLFRESIDLKPAVDSFRQGWKEVISGEIIPETELWDGIDGK
jgi:hypothetical protein